MPFLEAALLTTCGFVEGKSDRKLMIGLDSSRREKCRGSYKYNTTSVPAVFLTELIGTLDFFQLSTLFQIHGKNYIFPRKV